MSEGSGFWRDKSLDRVAGEAMVATMQVRERAAIELQRRTIVSLDRAAAESARASQRLLVATWVLIALTAVLVVLTVAIIRGE